jgi:hypothetical protein
MTKDQKLHRILEIKSSAFDDICNLRLTVDSHRNFHLRVCNVINEVYHAIADINSFNETTSPTPPGFVCEEPNCRKPATTQVWSKYDHESLFFCEEHASVVLARRKDFTVVEDTPTL